MNNGIKQKKKTNRTYQKAPMYEPQLKKSEDRNGFITTIPSERTIEREK